MGGAAEQLRGEKSIMKTKIYGTIGPACCDTEMLVHLFEKGMTGIRINLSHADLEEADAWISGIHSAWSRLHDGTPEILIDLRGPELRIGTLGAERLLKEGDGLSLVADGQNNLFDPTEIPVPGTLLVALAPGQEILLDDGRIALKVEEQFRCGSSVAVECTVVRGGVLKSGKSIAAPGVEIQTPTLTERDYRNLARVKQCRITGVMLPFVRNQEDLKNLKEALINEDAGDIRIFAKIENLQGMEHLGELLPHCDEIVIARGDLGNAMSLAKLPCAQEEIAAQCRKHGRAFMVVTQMLASMEHRAVPDAGGSVRYIPCGAAGRGICDADGRDRCGRISAGGDGGSGGYGAGGGVVSGRAQIVGHKMSFIQHLLYSRGLCPTYFRKWREK